jgi:hypothetical protein
MTVNDPKIVEICETRETGECIIVMWKRQKLVSVVEPQSGETLDVTNVVKHQEVDGFSVFENPKRFGQDIRGLRRGGDMTNVDFP